MPRPTRHALNAAGEETRSRLLDATLATMADVGWAGASSRAIAARAGVNQALIFYHFGSHEGLVAAAAQLDSERRATRYADRLAGVTSLNDLVDMARELHRLERESGSLRVLAQLLVAADASPELRTALGAAFTPWVELVQGAVERALSGTPFAALVPSRLAAITISSLFVGMELVADLDPVSGADQVLDFLTDAATVVASLMPRTPATPGEAPR